MRWIKLLTPLFLALTLSCGKPLNLSQSSDLPSVKSIQVDQNSITLQGNFLNRVTRLRLTGNQVDTPLTLKSQAYDQIEATPPSSMSVILGATYNLLISSAEADSSATINFIINPGQITPDLLDRTYAKTVGDTFSGDVAVSGQLSTTGGLSANTATISAATLGVTTVTPSTAGVALTVGNAAGVKGNLLVNGTGGTCSLGGATGNVNCTSDLRVKTQIREIPDALKKLKSLRGIYYKWKSTFKEDSATHIGLIAQEVEKPFPELVSDLSTSQGTYRSVDYAGVVAPLVQAVKELDTQLTDLKTQFNQQQAELSALKNELKHLKSKKNH